MTPATVRMVLVEGENADGAIVDYDVFEITGDGDGANSSAPEQVIAAILGTQESADTGGHRLVSTGVVWSDHNEAATLRHDLAVRGIEDVFLVSQLHAAAALAQAVGRAVDHDKTAMLFIERDNATLSVVETVDGSIVKVETRSLHSADALDVLTTMVTALEEDSLRPESLYLLGSGVDLDSIKEHLQSQVTIPLNVPDEPDMALARGAALASASAPDFEALTVGIAYSQDLDATTAGNTYADDETLLALATDGASIDDGIADLVSPDAQPGRKPFLLVGSSMTAIFVVGVVALVISLAVSIRPTVGTRPNPSEGVVQPTIAAPAPPAIVNPPVAVPAAPPPAAPPPAPPPAAPAPAPQTIPEPVPVVQQQPAPRAVVAQNPAPAAAVPAPAPEVQPPAPAVAPPALAPALSPPAPAYDPLVPGYVPPAPVYQPPGPAIGIPGIISIGPGPSRDPGWYPRQRWPDQSPSRWPDESPQQQWPQQSGRGGDWGPGSGSRGHAPWWPFG